MVKLCDLDLLPFQSRLNIEGLDFELLVESVREHGVLEPLLARPKGERFEVAAGGRRLRAAQKAGLLEVPVHVKDMTDEEAMDVHFVENLHRADLTEEEKRTALGNYARIRKLDAKQIAANLQKSYSWVVLYLPSEFKDEKMAELGQKGGEAKAVATRLVAEKHTVKTQDMTQCEYCHIASSDIQTETVNSKPRKLCVRCQGNLILQPERFTAFFRNMNGESKAAEHEPAPKPLYTEKYEHKLGTMQTDYPEAERFFDEEAQALGIHGIRTHPKIPVIEVEPDKFHVEKNTLFWMDNTDLHEGKRADKDEKYREILEKRGFKNEVHTYKGKTTRARVREFLVAWMKKAGLDKVEAS
jgi:ParB/RepB/Spo0J family partition protein